MGFENNDGGSVWANPLPGSEGLRTFWWNVINKFDLQTANDLFERYSADKDPQTLGKINELHLDVMKRAAEAELAKLWSEGNRTEIEASMNDPRIPKGKLNEHLPYVLVGYLKNVDKLAAERAAATTAVKQEARFLANNLLTTIPQNGQFFDFDALKLSWKNPDFNMTKSPPSGVSEQRAEAKGKVPASETRNPEKEKPAETQTQREERLSAEFVRKERAKIDQPLSKLPNETKTKISELLKNPNKENVSEIQKTLGMSGKGSQGVDGRFWRNTLAALEKHAEPKRADEAKWEGVKTADIKEGAKPVTGVEKAAADAGIRKPESKTGAITEKRLQMALKDFKPAEDWAFVLNDSGNSKVLFKFEPMNWEWQIKSDKADWLPVKGILNHGVSEMGLKLAYGDNGFNTIKNLGKISELASSAEIQEVLSGLNAKFKKEWLDPNAKSHGITIPKGYEGWTAAYAEAYARQHPYVLAKDR